MVSFLQISYFHKEEKMDPTALYKISYGLYVITSKKGDKINGQIANALIQVTGEPPALAIGINTQQPHQRVY